MLLSSTLPRFLAWTALAWGILASWPVHAQPQGSDVFNSSGEYDRFAVGGAHRWYDHHSDEFKQKGSHCLSMLDEAKVYQDKALELYEEARRPGNSRRQSELVRQANEQIRLRGEKLRAFTDCVTQANRRPMLQGKVEKNEGPQEQPPEEEKSTPPTKQKPVKKGPPTRQSPPPRVPPPPSGLPGDVPPASPPNGTPAPGGGPDPGPGRYKLGKPDPPFMFADGISKGMSDCFAENLPMDMATAPLAVLKRLERLKKAVEVVGKAGSIYAIYEDIKAYDPTADPYEVGKWLGKLICDGKDLRELVKQKKKTGPGQEQPGESTPHEPSPEDTSPVPPSQKPPTQDPDGSKPERFPHKSDPLLRGMPLEDHKQLVKLAIGEKKIIIVRDSNPGAMRWIGRPRHLPKPQELKAKTIPYDPSKSLEENHPLAGLASAQGLSDADRRALLQKGYTIRGKDQIIVDPKGNRLYSDTDLHGVYNLDGTDAWSPEMAQKMNDSFLENMVQHGPHDNWPIRNSSDLAGPNAGPKPPVTAYMPDGTTQHLKTIADMKQFYTTHGMDWNKLYPGY